MSIKYNSVADIPEDLKWIVEQDCPDTAFYQREGDEALFADSVYSSELHGLMPIWTRKAVIAAKECLAREREAVKWDGEGLPPVGAECLLDVTSTISHKIILCWCSEKSAVYRSVDSGGEELTSLEWFKSKVRPLKTDAELAAEKAAKEREAAIRSANEVWRNANNGVSGSEALDIIGALYDADRIKGGV